MNHNNGVVVDGCNPLDLDGHQDPDRKISQRAHQAASLPPKVEVIAIALVAVYDGIRSKLATHAERNYLERILLGSVERTH